MLKRKRDGLAVLLIVAAGMVTPIQAQSPPGIEETGSSKTDTSRDAVAATQADAPLEPATAEPRTASPDESLRPSAAGKPSPAALNVPAAAKPAVVKPAVTKPAVVKPPVAKPAVAKPAPVISIQGKLELVAAQKQTVDAGEIADGLVYFLPKAGSPKPKPGYFTIRTHSKGFSPSLLVVPAGSTIAFPNRDSVLHNVFSRTPGATFDLGNYGPGQTRQQVFTKPGLITVNCSVHHMMRATVVVMATPYYTRPDRNGRFELTDLPPGAGTLVYWHPRSAAATTQISLPNATAQKQRLIATKPRADQHAGAH